MSKWSESDILDAKKLLGAAFIKASPRVLKSLLMLAVSEHMVKKGARGVVDPAMVTNRNGALTKAVRDAKITTSYTGYYADFPITITSEAIIASKSAAVHEYGGTFPFTGEHQRAAMFARLKMFGEYRRDKANIGKGKKATYTFPPRPYAEKAIANMVASPANLKKILRSQIKEEFKNKTITVVVGK